MVISGNLFQPDCVIKILAQRRPDMKFYRLFFFITLLLSACSRGINPGGNPSEEGRLDGAVIVFSVSGGFAGVSREWIIYPDGRAINRMGEEFQAEPSEIEQLLDQIEDLGILEIKDTSGGLTDCRDCFTYNITFQTEAETFDFTLVEGDSETPAKLLEAAHAIDRFIQEYTEE
jgi:hypothetical protein